MFWMMNTGSQTDNQLQFKNLLEEIICSLQNNLFKISSKINKKKKRNTAISETCWSDQKTLPKSAKSKQCFEKGIPKSKTW